MVLPLYAKSNSNPTAFKFAMKWDLKFTKLKFIIWCISSIHNHSFVVWHATADVANSKCYQRLDEILIIFTCTIQEISKVVCKKTMSQMRAFITSLCCMKRVHYSKRMLHKQDCLKFHGHIAWQEFFFWKQLCWFPQCSAGKKKKKIKISSSRWWRFQLATSPIYSLPQSELGISCNWANFH